MPDIWMDADIAIAEAPVNLMPLIDDTDFKSIEAAVAYDAAGMALLWHFVTTAGVMTETAVTPTTGGAHDWTDQGTSGLYALEIPASAGTINNDTEGFGWFTGVADGVLPWRGPVIGFRPADLNNALVDVGGLLTAIDVGLLYEATISVVNTQLSYDMGTGLAVDDLHIGNVVTIEDADNSTNVDTGWVADLAQANDRIIVAFPGGRDPRFTVQTTDTVRVYAYTHAGYHAAQELSTYDSPTQTQLTSDFNAVPAAVWAVQAEDQGGGYTCQEAMSILLAEAAGTAVYTSGTRTWVVKDPSGTETRLTVVYSAELDGDRSTSTPAPMTP